MKKLIFTLLIIAPVLLNAQDYTNICSPGTTFFKKSTTNMMKAFKPTSYTLPGGSDTIFYSFRTIRDSSASCLDTTKGSIFGRKIYRVATTKFFYFFNKKGDTVAINAKGLVNDTWKFVNLTSGTYLEAKVVSMGPDSVINTIDDVMKIELTAKRNDGTVISNPWNGKYLKLSKHYGLSRTFDFLNVPYDTTYYTLVGKQTPVIGLQDFGWKEVYNFSIGDMFHFSGYDNGLSPGQTRSWKEIKTIIGKTVYGNNDSVQIKYDRCRSTWTNPGGTNTMIHDTLTVMHNFKKLASDSSIYRFPDQFKRENIYATQYDRFQKLYNNRQTKKLGQDKYRYINTCWVVPTGAVIMNKSYSEGLGQTEYFRDDYSIQNYYKLVYFKKGTETWGVSLGTQCSPTLEVNEAPAAGTREVRILPNPMQNRATVQFTGFSTKGDCQFVLYNIVGREVLRNTITSASMSIEKNNLPSGLYIYTVTGNGTPTTGKLIIE